MNMCDIVWWSLFNDSFNSGFICSRTVNLALNHTLNCHWTNDRPFFTTSIRCEHTIVFHSKHSKVDLFWDSSRRFFIFFFLFFICLCVQVYSAVFYLFQFPFWIWFFFWPPVDRTIENWITCRHNLSLHRFITVWCCATIIRFIACSVTFVGDIYWWWNTWGIDPEWFLYYTKRSYCAIQFARRISNKCSMWIKNDWEREREKRAILCCCCCQTWFVYKTLFRTLLKVIQWKGIWPVQMDAINFLLVIWNERYFFLFVLLI